MPLLQQYQSDGTLKRISFRTPTIAKKAEGKAETTETGDSFMRVGAAGVEMLSQVGCVKSKDVFGNVQMSPIVDDPVRMWNGKTTLFQYSATAKFGSILPQVHPLDVSLSVYCFDRGVFQHLSTFCNARHLSHHRGASVEVVTVDADDVTANTKGLAEHLDWPYFLPCAAHDFQNSFKWSVVHTLRDADAQLSVLYIVVASLRNSYLLVVRWLIPWLTEVIEFSEETATEEDRQDLWVAFGIDPSWLPAFVKYNPKWNQSKQKLLISMRVIGNEKALKELSSMFLYVFKFRKCKFVRWICLSSCSRTLLASWRLGLDHFAKFIRKHNVCPIPTWLL